MKKADTELAAVRGRPKTRDAPGGGGGGTSGGSSGKSKSKSPASSTKKRAASPDSKSGTDGEELDDDDDDDGDDVYTDSDDEKKQQNGASSGEKKYPAPANPTDTIVAPRGSVADRRGIELTPLGSPAPSAPAEPIDPTKKAPLSAGTAPGSGGATAAATPAAEAKNPLVVGDGPVDTEAVAAHYRTMVRKKSLSRMPPGAQKQMQMELAALNTASASPLGESQRNLLMSPMAASTAMATLPNSPGTNAAVAAGALMSPVQTSGIPGVSSHADGGKAGAFGSPLHSPAPGLLRLPSDNNRQSIATITAGLAAAGVGGSSPPHPGATPEYPSFNLDEKGSPLSPMTALASPATTGSPGMQPLSVGPSAIPILSPGVSGGRKERSKSRTKSTSGRGSLWSRPSTFGGVQPPTQAELAVMQSHVKPFVTLFLDKKTDFPGVLESRSLEKADSVMRAIWHRFWDKIVFDDHKELAVQRERHIENKLIGERLNDLDAFREALVDYADKESKEYKLRENMLKSLPLVDCYWNGKVDSRVESVFDNKLGRTVFRRVPSTRMQLNTSVSKFGSISVQPFPFQMTFRFDDKPDEKLFLGWHKRSGELGSQVIQDSEDGFRMCETFLEKERTERETNKAVATKIRQRIVFRILDGTVKIPLRFGLAVGGTQAYGTFRLATDGTQKMKHNDEALDLSPGFNFMCTNITTVESKFSCTCSNRVLSPEMSWDELVRAGLNTTELEKRVATSSIKQVTDRYKSYNYNEYITKQKERIRILSYAFYCNVYMDSKIEIHELYDKMKMAEGRDDSPVIKLLFGDAKSASTPKKIVEVLYKRLETFANPARAYWFDFWNTIVELMPRLRPGAPVHPLFDRANPNNVATRPIKRDDLEYILQKEEPLRMFGARREGGLLDDLLNNLYRRVNRLDGETGDVYLTEEQRKAIQEETAATDARLAEERRRKAKRLRKKEKAKRLLHRYLERTSERDKARKERMEKVDRDLKEKERMIEKQKADEERQLNAIKEKELEQRNCIQRTCSPALPLTAASNTTGNDDDDDGPAGKARREKREAAEKEAEAKRQADEKQATDSQIASDVAGCIIA